MAIEPFLANIIDGLRPLTGDILLIGRQPFTDGSTTDMEFFGRDGGNFHCLDISAYEGADIIHDLNDPLPPSLHGICDFLFNGSCLDNLFDPANSLRAFSKMLRPGGRMLIKEHGTPVHGALIAFSPEWFFDFFAVNDYVDCKITLVSLDDNGRQEPWHAYENDVAIGCNPAHMGDFYNIIVAQKGSESTDDNTATQAQYRGLHSADDSKYLAAYKRWKTN